MFIFDHETFMRDIYAWTTNLSHSARVGIIVFQIRNGIHRLAMLWQALIRLDYPMRYYMFDTSRASTEIPLAVPWDSQLKLSSSTIPHRQDETYRSWFIVEGSLYKEAVQRCYVESHHLHARSAFGFYVLHGFFKSIRWWKVPVEWMFIYDTLGCRGHTQSRSAFNDSPFCPSTKLRLSSDLELIKNVVVSRPKQNNPFIGLAFIRVA